MTAEAPQEEQLTGPHNAEQEVQTEQQQETEVQAEEISKAADVASDLVSWTKTPAGKDTIERLQTEVRKAMNELFAVLHEDPELGRLISVAARFEANVQMLRRFVGAEEDLDALLDELSRKRPSASGSLAT